LLWLPLVGAALLAIYLPSLGNSPVFDDAYLVDGDLFTIYRSWLEPRARMFSYGSFVWVKALFGDGWWKQRIVNLIIHLGVVVALWGFYREILRNIELPPAEGVDAAKARVPYVDSPALGLAIAFFALNPVAVYAVAYLIQRSILMATFFVVAGLWAFARGLRTGRRGLYGVALACYVLGVMSKEHALFAPLAALPIYILVARPNARRLALVAGAGVALVGAAALFLAMQYGEIIGKPFDEYSRVYLAQLAALSPGAEKHAFGLSIMNQAYLFFQYGFRWILPFADWMSISMRPPFPVAWLTFPQVLGVFGYVAILVAGFAALVRFRDWRALVAVCVLIPALLFATEFATVWVQDPFVLYRSYLWAIGMPGLVFFLAYGASARMVLAVGIAAGGLLVWQALDRVLSMETPEAAWTDAIAKLPRDPRAVGRWFPYLNRGSAYVERNQFDLAMNDFAASAQLGDLGMGTFNTGSLLAASGKHAQALEAFDSAEKQGYNLYNLPFQRAQSLLALNRPQEAFRQLEITWNLNPPSPARELVLLNLGRSGLQLGKPDGAVVSLDQLLAIDPSHKDGRFLLAMAHIARGDPGSARAVLDKLLVDDRSARVHYASALANYALKRKPQALADIEMALRSGPDNPHLREWQAKIKAMP
jgi:tetratricopeptide (TPR) repeat protein